MGEAAKAFAAYPSRPRAIADCFSAAAGDFKYLKDPLNLHLWEENDIVGQPLISPILENIDESKQLVADITTLNFNVTFEIGYAIAKGKPVTLTLNSGLEREKYIFSQIGIYDTIGYLEYQNSAQLLHVIGRGRQGRALKFSKSLDQNLPVFLLEPPTRTDAMMRLVGRIRRARLKFRSFNPFEDMRLSAPFAIEQVSRSIGVIVPILSSDEKDADIHNIRAAFIAGLAYGLGKKLLLLQNENGPAPLDVRDFVQTYRRFSQIDEFVHEFAFEVYEVKNSVVKDEIDNKHFLADLRLGDPMAENEYTTLSQYYLRTDEFYRAQRGEVNLIVGRKGTGKTALFLQLVAKFGQNSKNIVVDLHPEAFQLLRLKDDVLGFLADGAQSHLITALWEYILLMEICYKILEKDKKYHYRDVKLKKLYEDLETNYGSGRLGEAADFSERLGILSDSVTEKFSELKTSGTEGEKIKLNNDQITQLIYMSDLKVLRDTVTQYLLKKDAVWILLDNLDKGWSSDGVSKVDILMLRCLIDASRKIQREFSRKQVPISSIIFVRNDIYELLVRRSSDFGKELRASLDWQDRDLLKEMMRKRFVQNDFSKDKTFNEIWSVLCISHIAGEETSNYIIERSLMRPRNLLKAFSLCRGVAVNMGHESISADDLRKGMEAYSNDVLADANRELLDLDVDADKILYRFFEEGEAHIKSKIIEMFSHHKLDIDKSERILGYLLYYGFFGIRRHNEGDTYIYDLGYVINKMNVIVEKLDDPLFVLNPAFHASLRIKGSIDMSLNQDQ